MVALAAHPKIQRLQKPAEKMMQNPAATAANQARQHAENLWKGFGFADLDGLNLEREGTVELDPAHTGDWNAWVRYRRDDNKQAWISMKELARALEAMEDDQATWLEGAPSPDAIYNQHGMARAIELMGMEKAEEILAEADALAEDGEEAAFRRARREEETQSWVEEETWM